MAVYGIDLGTCYSCIARNDGAGSVQPIKIREEGDREFTPSVVSFDSRTGAPVVGRQAKTRLRSQPDRTIAFVKREMDKEFCNDEILVADTKRRISPIEPSACILKYLMEHAKRFEAGFGYSAVHQAVITVPAKFDEQQRARTMLAAELAGIDVLGLIQEPTAAAIAYDIPAGTTVLVFDLGGGTLDVSIVTNDKGNYKVIGTPAGDGQLGGMDWDEKMVELVMQKIGRRPDRSNHKEWNRFMSMAESIKQDLTPNNCDYIQSQDINEERDLIDDYVFDIERSEFEAKCIPLLERCWVVVDKAIANAKAENPKLKIDFFLTVGGSSLMPMIRKGLAARYGSKYGVGKAESDWLRVRDPETAIAIGAAKYAQLMLSKKTAEKNLKAVNDKATHSYGIPVLYEGAKQILNIVKSNNDIEYQATYDKFKLGESTRELSIPIYETSSSDEHVKYSDKSNRIINEKTIRFNKEMPAGTKVSLIIKRDRNGLIKITLKCGDYQETFEANPPEQLIDPEIKAQIEKSLSLMDVK